MNSIATFVTILVLSASSASASWLEVSSLPDVGRHHPVTFTLDGYGYVATGSAVGATYTDDFYRYDPTDDSWETLPDFPGTARSYAYGGAHGGKGYLGFGTSPAHLNDLWEYDPVSEQWTQLASLPGQGRAHPAFVITDDGKIFVGMGNWSQNLRDWWEYDIAGNTWTERTDLPGPTRHHPFYFNVGNTPYVGFGHGGAIYNDFYRWNRETSSWTQMAVFPGEGRVAGTQFSHGGRGYILSGEGEDHAQLDYGEFWEYNDIDDSWTEMPPHPGSGRWAPGTFLIDNAVYFLGGLSTVQLEQDVWKFELLQPAGVESQPFANNRPFVVYPNPVASERLHLLDPVSGHAPALDAVTIRLIDVDGREITALTNSSDGIRVPGLPNGMYFLSLSGKGENRTSRPFLLLR